MANELKTTRGLSDFDLAAGVRREEALSDFSETIDLVPEAAGDSFDLMPLDELLTSEGRAPQQKSAADFEALLLTRQTPEKPYGIFDKDVTVCRFSDSKNNENILADIERKNAEQGMGNILIPNTNIRLINYSVCPKCGKVFSFKDLSTYYGAPKSDGRFRSRGEQARGDARVFCSDCETWFLPALVIADKTPQNEVQFLCRNQTMNAVEKYLLEAGRQVLTKKKANILVELATGIKAVKTDFTLGDLAKKPTLIANILQYTPANLALNLLDGTNVEKGDVLYGWWGKGLA
jgi:predicted RNA-binding Zn ribbon-like protein